MASSERPALDRGELRQRIVAALRARRAVPDAAFDGFLPPALQLVAAQHWTPIEVALQVARWLDRYRVAHLVDVGAGAGKLAVAAALAGRFRVTGVEQRASLVATARALAHEFAVDDRVTFVAQVVGAAPLPAADAYYLYNPFAENLFEWPHQVDQTVELTAARFARDVAAAEVFLAALPPGALVVTYNGFGGVMPTNLEQLELDRGLPSELALWRRA